MAKINKIDIRIEKAIVKRISIELGEDKAEWSITAGLLTLGGKEITTFNTGNTAWNKKDHCEIPVEANIKARELFEIFMPIITREINGEFKSLPAPII